MLSNLRIKKTQLKPIVRARKRVLDLLLHQYEVIVDKEEKRVRDQFVPLRARAGIWYYETLLVERCDSPESDTLDIENLIQQNKQVVILGSPGSGKAPLQPNFCAEIHWAKILSTNLHF